MQCWGKNQGYMNARKALYQLNYIFGPYNYYCHIFLRQGLAMYPKVATNSQQYLLPRSLQCCDYQPTLYFLIKYLMGIFERFIFKLVHG